MSSSPVKSTSASHSELPVWIWSPQHDPEETNARFRFTRRFTIPSSPKAGRLQLSADSRYRLWLNGRWLGDGPARGYAKAPFFDEIPVLLQEGENELVVDVTHFGVDTFQYQRGSPGLWVVLQFVNGAPPVVSDLAWQVARVTSSIANTPRISCQLGFEEQLDLTRASASPVAVVLSARNGEKTVPKRRDLSLLEHREIPFQRLVRKSRVRPIEQAWTIHLRRLLSTFSKGINMNGSAGIFATELHAGTDDELEMLLLGGIYGVYLDGHRLAERMEQDLRHYPLQLSAGRHFLAIVICDRGDHITELAVGCRGGRNTRWVSPLPADDGFPWISTGPLWSLKDGTNCPLEADGTIHENPEPFLRDLPVLRQKVDQLAACATASDFITASPTEVKTIPPLYRAETDAYFIIRTEEEIETVPIATGASAQSFTLQAGECVVLDLGDIANGFFSCEVATRGTAVLDAYFFEHFEEKDGRIQYMQMEGNSYRTSFRGRFGPGDHAFFSTQRRGLRYALLIAREADAPVTLSQPRVVESLYRLEQRATFRCSDEKLEKIFEMSQRTLHLCMEDTFTDCPSYEQTFWVGDARNEALFAGLTFGSYDLLERCARLVADSLDQLPLAACQCPSGWDVLLPSFSFLWVISVGEIYQQTGNLEFVREMLPAVRKTLQTARHLCSNQGLYRSPTWNFFDWAPIDQGHETVLHNSLLLTEALKTGARLSELFGAHEESAQLLAARNALIAAINRRWLPEAQSFPDAILENGQPSPKLSQHTAMLALLYDLIPDPLRRSQAFANCLEPREEITRVGSPFAMFFLLQVLLREGHAEQVLEKVRSFWTAMLDSGSTTCWEMVFPPTEPFPTRSYCHGWSAAPVYLLPALFFGLEILEPGWKTIRLRPRNLGLSFVEASLCTPLGMLILRQKLNEEGQLTWTYEAPAGIKIVVDKSPAKS